MKDLLDKYGFKLVVSGFVEKGDFLFGGFDADIEWNKQHPYSSLLEPVFRRLSINSILFANPAEPYRTILDYYSRTTAGTALKPGDTETRTFLHDIPVIDRPDIDMITSALSNRKSLIIANKGILAKGMVSPEQAFIFFCSTCFSLFVKFFSDFYHRSNTNPEGISRLEQATFTKAVGYLDKSPTPLPRLMRAPFVSENEILSAIEEAGKAVVNLHLVDSFFGNVSFFHRGILYISRTSAPLDELPGRIDPCPLDGSGTYGVTASSEFIAHREIVETTGRRAVLHGHPKFSVIASLCCDRYECPLRGQCHIKCPEKRRIGNIPIVPGEVGAGRYGLYKTLPEAMSGNRGVIVYGHGLFTVGKHDFNEALETMVETELMCKDWYFGEIEKIKSRNGDNL